MKSPNGCTNSSPTSRRAALFAEKRGDRIVCGLCPRGCAFSRDGDAGFCGTRVLKDGALWAATYGRLLAARNDPIEKKPLYHYLPGSLSFSIAAAGCNLACPFCQNHDLSQGLKRELAAGRVPGDFVAPDEVVSIASRAGAISISVTYTEPVLLLEYVADMAEKARAEGLGIVFVTNGAWSRAAAESASRLIDAANVDLKCFSERRYKDVLGVPLSSVLDTIETLVAAGVWVEVTTLMVPGFSDDLAEIEAAAKRLAAISTDLPWHLSRFHPDYVWTDRQATPFDALRIGREIGLASGLKYVYTGNVTHEEGSRTLCPACGHLLVDRRGFAARTIGLVDGVCGACKAPIAGRWTSARGPS